MKRIFLLFVIALVGVNCYAQRQSAEERALQGTWILIGIMNDQESYNEQSIKAEGVDVSYIFSGNNLTIRKEGEVIGPVVFEPREGYLLLGPEGAAKLPYNLQGRILIVHEGGYAFVYRKR
ncbi:MAG: hypothetical protein LBU88_00565 [Treponema sp.]|jgi:hypothetical protein|nr:hypothetical protein [Treponema sp.]